MVFQVILFAVVLYYLVHIVLQIRQLGKPYFWDFWNWLEMLTTLMAIVSIGLYIGCVVTATDTFSTFLNNQRAFTNFERVADIHTAARYLHAWLLFFLMFKVSSLCYILLLVNNTRMQFFAFRFQNRSIHISWFYMHLAVYDLNFKRRWFICIKYLSCFRC